MPHVHRSPGELKFSDEIQALHGELSAAAVAFLKFAERTPEVFARHRFHKFEASPLMYYELHRWPLLIDSRRNRELEEVSVKLCRLVKRGPRLLLDGDPRRIADYYGVSLERARVATEVLANTEDARGALSRGDFIDSADGLKCLEINMMAGLGGWETGLKAQVVMDQPVLQRFTEEQGLRIQLQDTLRAFLSHVVEDVRRTVAWEGECNLAVLFPDNELPDAAGREMATLLLNSTLSELLAAEGAKGEVLIGTYSEVKDAEGHCFTMRGRRLHAVQEHDARDRLEVVGLDFDARVRAALAARTLCLYNGPAQELLDDKLNIALLSENEASPALTQEERELIRRHIPWTRRVRSTQTTRDGASVWLPDELAASKREGLVLKAGRAYGGKSVLIGRAMTAEDWDVAIQEGLEHGGWIVQERVEPRPYHFLRDDGAVGPHILIWGAFVFGERYGGTMVRLNPTGQGKDVVNATQGALMCALVVVE
ncbi:hypothetical protein QEG98_19385 [Myxococcus sp. MxC21-1]|uniref:hypothetical protein n=1 Tax=Myxococcus sp. MxC21-1 TaxID=3041439 RepID=UPI00292D5818|nr:hypothetical protein [Myxococcus sp. MxC21-1]WNZ65586.1 hypothetical protein QEG98_19385 [Myxococcus sp. MxC21-1]